METRRVRLVDATFRARLNHWDGVRPIYTTAVRPGITNPLPAPITARRQLSPKSLKNCNATNRLGVHPNRLATWAPKYLTLID
jgi:hypothetical protein